MCKASDTEADADGPLLGGAKRAPMEMLPVGASKTAAAVDTASEAGIRHGMLFLCFLCTLLCYADRTNLSVALVAMRLEFGWSGATSGSLLSAFFIGCGLRRWGGSMTRPGPMR